MKLNKSIDDIETHLETIEAPSFDKLDFQWEGIHFHAASHATPKGDSGEIYLKGKLGQLYFTIEDPVQRTSAIEQVYTTNKDIDGAYKIDRDGVVHFESVTLTDYLLIGTELVSALTLILLEAETHLRLLRAHLKALN